METFNQHVRETRIKWFDIPTDERAELISSLARMDPTAVAKLKMVGRTYVNRGKTTDRFLEDFYAVVDDWLGEIRSKESGILVYKKVAAITYAKEMAI